LPGRYVGHSPGTGASKDRMNRGENGGAAVGITVAPITPRLLTLHGAAAYLGLSVWKVRELEAAKVLRRVRLPVGNGSELRKLLFDRVELDAVIEQSKETR